MNGTTSTVGSARYYLHDFWEVHGDPRMSKFPLIHGGPWKVMAVSITYLLLMKVLIPRMMKGRKPFDLRSLMLLHNSFLIGVNGCGFFVGLWVSNMGTDTWNCDAVNPDTTNMKYILMIYLGYVYFLTKIVDFFDTLFFVLRKRYHQASFLHLFHHSVMPIVAYVGLKFHPGGYSGFLPVVNVFIHAVMYAYYALACAGPEMKKHLWWKKHITQIQLIQFLAIFFHASNALLNPRCWPWYLSSLELLHACMFLYMFSSFYRRVYWNPSPATNNLQADTQQNTATNGITNNNIAAVKLGEKDKQQ